MNVFQLTKTVLDELYAKIPGATKKEKDAKVNAALTYLAERYGKLLSASGPSLDYSDPVTRFAYIFRYVTCHANLVCSVIEQSDELKALFKQDKVSVTCLGGGPGSDFLGILKYVMASRKQPELKCRLLDKEAAWAESWEDVDEKVKVPFRISNNFHPIDVGDYASWSDKSKYLQADLFTLIFFVSELFAKLKEPAGQFLKHVLVGAKPGALLLYIDDNNSSFYSWFDKLLFDNGWEIIDQGRGSMRLPREEQTKDLGEYCKEGRFGSPRLKPDVAWRIARKPG